MQESNLFYKCGTHWGGCLGPAEKECCYLCVPGGPCQAILCMANPVAWTLCILPEKRAGKKANAAVAEVLGKHSVHCALSTGIDIWGSPEKKIKFSTM